MKQIAALLFLTHACAASQVIMGGSGSKKDGGAFRYETRVEPPIPGQKLTGFGGGGLVVGQRFHRFMEDGENKRFFGYDLDIEKQPDGTLRISFHPLEASALKSALRNPSEWAQLPTPRLPANQIVSGGPGSEAIAVELFTHPVTGQKIVDYLFFDGTSAPHLPSGPARDFTLDDVPLTFENMRIKHNGMALDRMGGGVTGEAVFFYVPGLGRYVMSLAPNADLGFHRAGEVRGSEVTIQVGGDKFEIACNGPVAPGGGAFHLYVHHDPTWQPRGGAKGPMWGASQARALVRNRLTLPGK